MQKRLGKENNLHKLIDTFGSLILMNLVLLLFFFVLTQIQPIDHFRNYSIERQEGSDKEEVYIWGENTLSQSFRSSDKTDSVEIYINAYNGNYHGTYLVTILDKDGNKIKQWKTDKLDLKSEQQGKEGWIYYWIGPDAIEENKEYIIEITAPKLEEKDAIVLATYETNQSRNEMIGGECRIDGKQTNRVLAFSTYRRQTNLFAILAVVILFAMANIWWFLRKKDIIKSALLVLIGTGLIMLLIMAPGSQPDEGYHYNSCVRLSNVMLGRKQNINEVDTEKLLEFTVHYNSNQSFLKLLNEATRDSKTEGGPSLIEYSDSLTNPVAYLAPATGVSLVHLFGGNNIQAYTAARVFNLASYILMAFMAIYLIPCNKQLMLLLCIMPMAMHQAVSVSRDVFVNGMSLLFFAYIGKIVYRKEFFSWKKTAICAALLALFGPVKIVYCSLALLIFLIPGDSFGSTRDRILKTLTIILGMLIVLLIMRWNEINSTVADTHVSDTGVASYHLSFLFRHPVRYFRLIVNTYVTSFWKYIKEAIGSHLAGLNIRIKEILIVPYIMILIACTFGNDQARNLFNKRQQTFSAIIAICGFVAVAAAFSFAMTRYGELTVDGIQGRYLIPFFAPILYAFNSKAIRIRFDKSSLMYPIWIIELGFIVDVMSRISLYTE